MKHSLMAASFTILLAVSVAQAKTVALWPMEYDPQLGAPNMHCAVNSDNDFTNVPSAMVFNATTLGWNLPPNPDSSPNLLFSPVCRYELESPLSPQPLNANCVFSMSSDTLSEQLNLMHDFTIEGWLWPRAVQDNSWHLILHTHNGGTGYWSWAIRNDKSGNPLGFYIYAYGSVGDTMLGDPFTESEAVDLTNRWHHVALSFRRDYTANTSQYAFFYDGAPHGTIEFTKRAQASQTSNVIRFGGRNGPPYLSAKWNCWRVSDQALDATGLMNYGGAGSTVTEPAAYTNTVAYWKLGGNADGSIDARDYVGGFQLSQGILDSTSAACSTNRKSAISASTDCAFHGQPPNSTVSISGGNNGSLIARSKIEANVHIPELGRMLEMDRDFTVEGYFRCREDEDVFSGYPKSDAYVFGTRLAGDASLCWLLRYFRNGKNRRLSVLMYDRKPDGTQYSAYEKVLCNLPDDPRWMHIALVYDHAAGDGKGVWTIYIDGEEKGSGTNSVFTYNTCSQTFMMLGRGGSNDLCPMAIDCVRVSGAALSPNQFLCESENPVAATDVLAFWPLDSSDGVNIDGRDEVGGYSFTSGTYSGADYRPVAVPDSAPSIGNPDRSGSFHGVSSAVSGSVRFRSGDVGKKAFLASHDYTLARKVSKKSEWTLEFYTKRYAQPTLSNPGELILLSAAADALGVPNNNSGGLTLAYSSGGFAIYDSQLAERNEQSLYTMKCDGTAGAIPVGEWTHVAITRSHDASAATTVWYRFYVNGELAGSVSGTEERSFSADVVYIGGCYNHWNTECAWNGEMSSVRFSGTVLSPSDFLCADPPAAQPAVDTGTLAYWPLEYSDGTLDLSSRSAYGYRPKGTGYATSGSDLSVSPRVNRPDRTVPVLVRKNVGSVALSSGGTLPVPLLARRLTYDRAFSVEGSIRWVSSGASAKEVLFGTASSSTNAGWSVYIDHSGSTPALKLIARDPGNWSGVASGTLVPDISGWSGEWKNIVLVYDPVLGGVGRWRLYVDNELAGTVDNAWNPGSAAPLVDAFTFSSDNTSSAVGFAGNIDQWRVVGRVLETGEFLYAPSETGGLTVILK